jgi:hypothetical protein
MFQPDAHEAALLVLHLLDRAGSDRRPVSRARLTEITIRRLWSRTRVPEAFLLDVQEILLNAGWVFFWAGSSFAIIKREAVDGWPRISSKRIDGDLRMLAREPSSRNDFFAEADILRSTLMQPDDEEEEDAGE